MTEHSQPVVRPTDPINKVCAIGSVAAAIALLFVFGIAVALVIYIITESLGVTQQVVDHTPRLPTWAVWPCRAFAVLWLTTLLYPKCMKARIARRLSHG